MRRLLFLSALTPALLAAQTAATNASVSGVVKDKITGQPLANYTVSTFVNATWVGNTILQTSRTKNVTSTTDSSGRYKLTDLPPGAYRIAARDAQHFGSGLTRHVAVNGSDVRISTSWCWWTGRSKGRCWTRIRSRSRVCGCG